MEAQRIEVMKAVADGRMSMDQGQIFLDQLFAVPKGYRRTKPPALPVTTAENPLPGRLFLYIRVSSDEQARSGLSLEAQKQAGERYFEFIRHRPEYALLEWGGIYADEGVSAFTIHIMDRPQGRLMNLALRPNDHIVFVKFDRAFRSTRDFVQTHPKWQDRGITIHFLDLGVDLSTPNGWFFATIMSAVAELESKLISARCRAAHAISRQRNGMVNGQTLRHCEIVRGTGGERKQALSWDKTALVRLMIWYKRQGWGEYKIADQLERLCYCKRKNKGSKSLPDRRLLDPSTYLTFRHGAFRDKTAKHPRGWSRQDVEAQLKRWFRQGWREMWLEQQATKPNRQWYKHSDGRWIVGPLNGKGKPPDVE